jgi:hypothetical protein
VLKLGYSENSLGFGNPAYDRNHDLDHLSLQTKLRREAAYYDSNCPHDDHVPASLLHIKQS